MPRAKKQQLIEEPDEQDEEQRPWSDLALHCADALVNVFLFLPMSPYYFSLRALGRRYRDALSYALKNVKELDLTNMKGDLPLIEILRLLGRHSASVATPPPSDDDDSSLPFNPKYYPDAVVDSEFPWIYHLKENYERVARQRIRFSNAEISRICLPKKFAELSFNTLFTLVKVLPNLKKITFSFCSFKDIRSALGCRSSFRADSHHYRKMLSHAELEEIEIISAPLEKDDDSQAWLMLSLPHQQRMPKLKTMTCVSCPEVLNFYLFSDGTVPALRRVLGDKLRFEVWNTCEKKYLPRKICRLGSGVAPIHWLDEQPNMDTKPCVRLAFCSAEVKPFLHLSNEEVSYLVNNRHLSPKKVFMIGKLERTLIEASEGFAMSDAQMIGRLLDQLPNVELIDVLQDYAWNELIVECYTNQQRNDEDMFIKALTRLAARRFEGKLLSAKCFRTAIKKVLLRQDQKYYTLTIERIIDLLKWMSSNGLDLYADDYAWAALPIKQIFDTILELDKSKRKRGKSPLVNYTMSPEEQKARYVALLTEATRNGWYESALGVVELAGAETVINEPINERGWTLVHYCINDTQLPYGMLEHVLSLKPADIRAKNGESFLHLAAQGTPQTLLATMKYLPHLDINSVDDKGNTVLHILCDKADIWIADLLVTQFGADPSIANKQGSCPADQLQNAEGRKVYQWKREHKKAFTMPKPVPESLQYSGFEEKMAQRARAEEERLAREEKQKKKEVPVDSDEEMEAEVKETKASKRKDPSYKPTIGRRKIIGATPKQTGAVAEEQAGRTTRAASKKRKLEEEQQQTQPAATSDETTPEETATAENQDQEAPSPKRSKPNEAE